MQCVNVEPRSQISKFLWVLIFVDGADGQAKMELLSELELMKTVGSHPNVVRLLGHCTETGNTILTSLQAALRPTQILYL